MLYNVLIIKSPIIFANEKEDKINKTNDAITELSIRSHLFYINE